MRRGTCCRHCGVVVTRRGMNSNLWADESRSTECGDGIAHEPIPAGFEGELPVQGVDYDVTAGRVQCSHCHNVTILAGLSEMQVRAFAEGHICEQPQNDRLLEGCCDHTH